MEKIIRSICYFTARPGQQALARLDALAARFSKAGYEVQTLRLACPDAAYSVEELQALCKGREDVLLSVGHLQPEEYRANEAAFLRSPNIFFHRRIDEGFAPSDWPMLQGWWRDAPLKSFHFAFNANCPLSSPFFPSARYEREGFSIGLQSTNLALGAGSFGLWLQRMRQVWEELAELLAKEEDALGIDSSVAPLGSGAGSLLYWLQQWFGPWPSMSLRPELVELTNFLKTENPWPVGLCGLMLPCLEDFELAKAYEQGQFSLERNLYLSLHSGLGIDTYPAPLDSSQEELSRLGNLLLALAKKHKKCLSMRLISDGKAKRGMQSDFQNKYLQDVQVRGIGEL